MPWKGRGPQEMPGAFSEVRGQVNLSLPSSLVERDGDRGREGKGKIILGGR